MASVGTASRCRNAPMTNELISLDLSDFAKDGFKLEASFAWRWTKGGLCIGRLNGFLSDQSVRIFFQHEHGPTVEQKIGLEKTRPHFGGTRRWFVCPECSGRCRILYLAERFICRHCMGAVYASQYTWLRIPGEAKAMSVRGRLAVKGGYEALCAEKPKGMHWRNFRALERLLWDAEMAFEAHMSDKF